MVDPRQRSAIVVAFVKDFGIMTKAKFIVLIVRWREVVTPHNNPAKDFLLYAADEPHLARLPRFSRALLEAATNDGMSYVDIAAMFQIKIGTVKSRINRARERILKMRLEMS